MPIRIPGRHVEVVKDPTTGDEFCRCGRWQVAQEAGHNMPPSLLSVRQVEDLDGSLGGLVGDEASPLVTAVSLVLGSGLQVALRLKPPVPRLLCHAEGLVEAACSLRVRDAIPTRAEVHL